ncbi:MAG: copper resistance protein CopC [Chloroflexota bacterium]|nr:copper resistance protein CopC [Chloroflexota bacterium]
MRLKRLARAVAVAGLIAMAAMAPRAVLGHADLESSVPQTGATLATAPTEVALVFGGELVPEGSEFTVTDDDGRIVGSGHLDLAVAERNQLRGPVTITRPGTFTVAWTSVAADGHRETGAFTFAYGTPAPDTAASTPLSTRTAGAVAGSLLLLIAVAMLVRRHAQPGP